MGNIEFDFCAANQAVHQIEEVSNRMRAECLHEFENIMWDISDSWSGEAGIRFQGVAGRESEQLKQTIMLLEYTKNSLQDAIFIAKQAEEKTKEIAELRTY